MIGCCGHQTAKLYIPTLRVESFVADALGTPKVEAKNDIEEKLEEEGKVVVTPNVSFIYTDVIAETLGSVESL